MEPQVMTTRLTLRTFGQYSTDLEAI